MPTDLLLNGLSGNLQSSESWAQQQALDMLRQTLKRTLASLTPAQQRDYVRLQREAIAAQAAVDAENTAIIATFKTDGLAQLRKRLDNRDPEAIFLHTHYLEELSVPLPWEPRTSRTRRRSRFRRAYDEWKYRAHESRLSLWEAACLNFNFATRTHQKSGYTFIDASNLSGANIKGLTVAQFVDVSRDLDLGGQLKTTLQTALGPGGKLQKLLQTAVRSSLLFEALEAYRNRASTGVTWDMYEKFRQAIDGSGPALGFDTLGMTSSITLLPAIPFVASNVVAPVPLLLIRVASVGVLSYFPFRPSGALQYHLDAKAAGGQFLQELKDSHRKRDLGWFSRQLPMVEMNEFKRLLTNEPRPEGLTTIAGFLYDGFHTLFPERTLDSLRFTPDPKHGRDETLVEALTYRQVQRYQANLRLLAISRTERDTQAVIEGAAAIADEVLQMLLTPVPGGVTGLNRTMQLVVFGSLTYSVIIGINEAAKGEASAFAAALTDVADLAVSGLLISTAGRVHRQRMTRLLERLGNPHKVTHADGVHALWKSDITPFATLNQNLLNGQEPNALGIYPIRGKQYVWLQHGEQKHVVEVRHDAQSMRFVLSDEYPSGFAPPIIFDPTLQAWKLDRQNAHALSDLELAERMLPNGSSPVPRETMENMLRSTATPRTTLNQVWQGEAAPVNLIEGVRRLRADQVIEQLIKDFHRRGDMPPHADSAVLCLLTQLPTWPQNARINVHDPQGLLIERYAGPATPPPNVHEINLRRRDDGTYIALDTQGPVVTLEEQLFELIIGQQPAASTLGKEGSTHLTLAQRIARLRLQIAELAKSRRIDLFQAMIRYAGYTRDEVPAHDSARPFVPLMTPAPLVAVTPLLKKMRDLHPPLSVANLAQILAQRPMTAAQQNAFLEGGTLSQSTSDHIEQHRMALRIDAAIDGLYHARAFNPDNDQWAREFASHLVRNKLDRHFLITEVVDGAIAKPYTSSGPDDTTVELRHYGAGRYEAYDMRNAGTIAVSPAVDSFYLAIGSVLQPAERTLLGMSSATDAKGLRKTLGDLMSNQRSVDGLVSLLNGSLAQYEQTRVLPADLQPDQQGIFELDGQKLLPLYGSLYPIVFDRNRLKWRLKHPQKVGVDTPTLENNRQGIWRLSNENPMTWDEHSLFHRLGRSEYNVDQATSKRILAITDTPTRALREVHTTNGAPPPLLADTSKRFRLERDLLHFIQAMTTYSAIRNVRSDLQLLILTGLPGWPATHVLQVVDSEGKALAQFPPAAGKDAQKVVIQEADSRTSNLLNSTVMNDAVIQAILGELPSNHEERRFKLAKKIAEYADQERAQFFETLYITSERGSNEQENRFKAHHPHLPFSAVRAILQHATPKELKQLQAHNQVGLRLAEQARLSANDIRLNRAFEGLYLTTLDNPDSDRIILHLLKSVPGWPAQLRLDIHQGTAAGPLLESAGQRDGTTHRILARVGRQYQAYDSDNRLLNDPASSTSDLLTAIAQVLSVDECKTLGVVDSDDLSPLRHAIADLALNQRVAIKALLGLPHIPLWLQPPMPINSSFQAYPFSLKSLWPFSGNRPVDLVSKTRELYPSFSVADANDLISSLGLSEPAALIELQRRKAEYQALEYGLARWVEAAQPLDLNDPEGINQGQRRHLAEQIRKAWRRETRQPYDNGLFNVHRLVLQMDGNGLPDVDFIFRTQGFEHIRSLQLVGDEFPANGNAFLSKFSSLRSLQIECRLNEVPAAITEMTQLKILNLDHNNITLTPESQQRLSSMTQLRVLSLNYNPLGLAPDIRGMFRLRVLELRNTGVAEWPIGADERTDLEVLDLRDNLLVSLPDGLFSNIRMMDTNRITRLHDNPLSEHSLLRIIDYRNRSGIALGGIVPGIEHVQATPGDLTQWLVGVPATEHASRQRVWEQLQNHEGANPDDAFRVLRDLTKAFAYIKNQQAQQALTGRVWQLLNAMADSTELRNRVFLNTYVAGTCGDGALLAFIDMEIELKIHQARAQPSSAEADRKLLELGNGLFYLRHVDRLAEDRLETLREAGIDADDAEVKLYYRLKLTNEFNLPVQREEMLYSVEDWVSEQDIAVARVALLGLSTTEALLNSLIMEEFWVEYLTRSYPEPFSTINRVSHLELETLNRSVADKRSDTYLEKRQLITDLEIAERNRLVRLLTEAAQLARRFEEGN